MLTDGDWDEAHPYFCADCGHQLGTERGFRVSVEKIEISDSHSDLNPSADISIRLWTRLCKILKSRPFVPGMLKSAILAHCANPVGHNFRELQGASSVAPYQLPKISSLRGSLHRRRSLAAQGRFQGNKKRKRLQRQDQRSLFETELARRNKALWDRSRCIATCCGWISVSRYWSRIEGAISPMSL